MENRRSLTIKQISDILCLSYQAAYQFVYSGRFKPFYAGRNVRVWADEFYAYLESTRLKEEKC